MAQPGSPATETGRGHNGARRAAPRWAAALAGASRRVDHQKRSPGEDGSSIRGLGINDDTCVIRRPRRAWLPDVLTAAAIIATVALALLTAGCGGGGSPAPPVGGAGLPAGTAQALAYAQCMRSHGIPGFPDPNTHGNILFSLPASIDTHSPQFQSADKTCQKQTGFGHFSAAQQQQGMTAMLKYAKCMRAHGITNYPDPSENSQQIGFNLTGTGIDLKSPKVEAASKTCQPFWPFPR